MTTDEDLSRRQKQRDLLDQIEDTAKHIKDILSGWDEERVALDGQARHS